MTHLVLLAAGKSERFGRPKLLEDVEGRVILEWSLLTSQKCDVVDDIVLVLSSELLEMADELSRKYPKISKVVLGGRSRKESSEIGVKCVDGLDKDVVLIHDAARPFATCNLFRRVSEGVKSCDAVVPAVPLRDTVAFVKNGSVVDVPNRDNLKAIQTPQGFTLKVIKDAYEISQSVTDDSTLVLRNGGKVCWVEGEPMNIKITFPHDLEIVRALFHILKNSDQLHG